MLLPFLAVIAALVVTFAMPPSKDKQKFVAIPIGLGIVISIAMLINLLLRWEAGSQFGAMANAMNLLVFLYFLVLLWSAITILISVVPEWRSRAKHVVAAPILFTICYCFFLFRS